MFSKYCFWSRAGFLLSFLRYYFHPAGRRGCLFLALIMVLFALPSAATDPLDMGLQSPIPGSHTLHILTPNLLELVLVNTKQIDPAHVDSWDWVNAQGNFIAPNTSSVKVVVNGQTNNVTGIGFKRRPLYAPLDVWDLRIGNYLYLQLSSPISNGQAVQ